MRNIAPLAANSAFAGMASPVAPPAPRPKIADPFGSEDEFREINALARRGLDLSYALERQEFLARDLAWEARQNPYSRFLGAELLRAIEEHQRMKLEMAVLKRRREVIFDGMMQRECAFFAEKREQARAAMPPRPRSPSPSRRMPPRGGEV